MLQEPGTPKPIWEALRRPGLGKVLSGHVSRTTVSLFPPIPAPLILSLLAVARKSGQELGYLLLEAERKREKGVKVTEF